MQDAGPGSFSLCDFGSRNAKREVILSLRRPQPFRRNYAPCNAPPDKRSDVAPVVGQFERRSYASSAVPSYANSAARLISMGENRSMLKGVIGHAETGVARDKRRGAIGVYAFAVPGSAQQFRRRLTEQVSIRDREATELPKHRTNERQDGDLAMSQWTTVAGEGVCRGIIVRPAARRGAKISMSPSTQRWVSNLR